MNKDIPRSGSFSGRVPKQELGNQRKSCRASHPPAIQYNPLVPKPTLVPKLPLGNPAREAPLPPTRKELLCPAADTGS